MKSTKSNRTALATFSAALLMPVSSQAANVLLLSDNFNTGNNTNLNQNLATRQDGTLESAGSDWTEISGSLNAILNNQLNVNNGVATSHVVNNADFKSSLTTLDLMNVTGFTLSFKLQYTGTASGWTSPFLSTHTGVGDERANSQFGLLVFQNGNVQAYGDGGATAITNTTMTSLVSGWASTNQNSYSLVATRSTATTGTYDLFVNGIEVLSDKAYSIGAGGSNSEVNFEVINIGNGTTIGGAGLYDDFSLVTVPEPSSALLGGLGLLALLGRRQSPFPRPPVRPPALSTAFTPKANS